jgi:hypothetical protein
MARSSALYLLIVFVFAVVYIGTILFSGAQWLEYFLAFGIILFIVRIMRGDD